jgi:hypothetical protein
LNPKKQRDFCPQGLTEPAKQTIGQPYLLA